ncbi:phenylalanine--tRNA ligase subunit alpha [Candidatus Gottesmanbacteria bacterium]|nr:phenylalanine--tRNA ligase subunit alpha [Candidatus Gottesmanbacteria bacterium]
MEKDLLNIQEDTHKKLKAVKTSQELTALYLSVFGKSGRFAQTAKRIQEIPKDKKKTIGLLVNKVKQTIDDSFDKRKKELMETSIKNKIDVTIPAITPPLGHLHITTLAISEIAKIFERIGFTRVRYPEIDREWYAFESLNMPVNHPARDDFETFFIDAPPFGKLGRLVLSPHTSSGQVREMERMRGIPPIRMINIAKCYRPNWDISHTPMFHQFEGLVIDRGINVTHLKGTFEYFAREFFGPKRKIRLRPFHFQFTEPSFEVDITCDMCGGNGCRLCKEGWLELGGSGMVHPNVLAAGKIDPTLYTGYAFGWGIERTYMMKAGIQIDDLRILYANDIRFLEQF